MKKPSNLINEKVTGVQWLEHSILYAKKGMFPLTNSIAKELGLGRTITALHFTSVQKAMKLINIAGSDKSISAMTKVPMQGALRFQGVWSSGVIYKVQGDVLLSAGYDIMSKPDQRGRRWIGLSSLGNGRLAKDKIAFTLHKMYGEYLQKNERYRNLEKMLSISPNKLGYADNLKQFLSLHFDLSLQFAKENRDKFAKLFPTPGNDKIVITSGWDWNEIVLNNIKLIGVAYDIGEIQEFEPESAKALEQKLINSVPPGKAKAFKPKDKAILKWIKE